MKKTLFTSFAFVAASLALFTQCAGTDRGSAYTDAYMAGISASSNLGNYYVTSGNKAYCVGCQDGMFPDLSGHMQYEMGGIWANPIKLADGFSMRLSEGAETVLLDSPSSYTTYPYGSAFSYSVGSLEVERFQFIPQDKQGMLVSYRLKNVKDQPVKVDMTFSVRLDVLPSWFSKRAGVRDSTDVFTVDPKAGIIASKDAGNEWYAVCMAADYDSVRSEEGTAIPELETQGQGHTGSFVSSVEIAAGKCAEVRYVIAGSMTGEAEACSEGKQILENADDLLAQKKAHYEPVINRAAVSVPDKLAQDAYTYSKINDEWLVADLSGMHFLCAGAKEYPWLFGCDNSYSQQGVVVTGDFALAQGTLTALKEVSEKTNGNGRIIHEMSPFGCVFNRGNTQETAHFIVAVMEVFRWTGDVEWLKSLYPYMEKGIDWLFTDKDKDGNMFPEGYGIMEVSGLNAELIDVAVYSQQALDAMSEIAALFGEKDKSQRWKSMSDTLKDKINNSFWDEENGLYCDFYGVSEDAARVARDAAESYPAKSDMYMALADEFASLPAGTHKGFITNKNWVISVPMEVGIAPRERALPALDKVRKDHCGEFGPYLAAANGNNDKMMTISTGVQAVAEAKYGRMDQAIEYIDMIGATMNSYMPGSMNEMMPEGGCPAQAWTIYGPAKVLVSFVFGINPDADGKTVSLNPSLPTGWNEISIRDVRVGDMTFSLYIDVKDGKTSYKIDTDSPDWKFDVTVPGEVKSLSGKKHYSVVF